jgi:hypothetical protein
VSSGRATGTSIFDRIVRGVDGTAESLVAVERARRLRGSGGTLPLVAAMPIAKAAHAGMAAPHAAAPGEGGGASDHGSEGLAGAEGKIVNGDPAPSS